MIMNIILRCFGCSSCVFRLRHDHQQSNHLPEGSFTFQELAAATNNFDQSKCLGQGGFGKVYSGYIKRIKQTVAIKRLDVQISGQGGNEFETELQVLGQAEHPNFVRLIGHCAERTEKIIVYEYQMHGSLDHYLSADPPVVLDWNQRVKIALGAASGLDYLHNTMNPPFIYRDMKSSNILLGPEYVAKLSDFGIAKKGPTVIDGYVYSPHLAGTEGYRAPEYIATGTLTYESDVYSFGIVLLEIFMGKLYSCWIGNLVETARRLLSTGEHFYLMVDPRLQGNYPKEPMNRVFELATRCVNEDPNHRPSTSAIHSVLHDIASQPFSFQNG